jgi:hypothetical protein
MQKFIKSIAVFLFIFILMIVLGVILPPTPRASTAHLFSKIDKDLLLKDSPSPRMILIGGSNISMSINSETLKDSLLLNPVNTGLSASLGLFYMLNHTREYIKEGDVIIICPEYSQFYDNLSIGTEDLIRVVLDVSPMEVFKLRADQLLNGLKYIPRYAFTKYKFSEYWVNTSDNNEVYTRSSFNKYGDMTRHWNLGQKHFEPLEKIAAFSFDEEVLDFLENYKKEAERKGAQVYITFPAIHQASFVNQVEEIKIIYKKLKDAGFEILGTPDRYRMNSDVMFDTPYHLTKNGVDLRTRLLIEDLKKSLHFMSHVSSKSKSNSASTLVARD